MDRMVSGARFTAPDRATIGRAASLAEKLTGEYFDLALDEWKRNPYSLFTRNQVNESLYEDSVFAQVVRYIPRGRRGADRESGEAFGIVLQDPHILRALLRSTPHNLWTLGLFILTHELIHIVRFRRFGVDFYAPSYDRDGEEQLVHCLTEEILSGVANTDNLLTLYRCGMDAIRSDECFA